MKNKLCPDESVESLLRRTRVRLILERRQFHELFKLVAAHKLRKLIQGDGDYNLPSDLESALRSMVRQIDNPVPK